MDGWGCYISMAPPLCPFSILCLGGRRFGVVSLGISRSLHVALCLPLPFYRHVWTLSLASPRQRALSGTPVLFSPNPFLECGGKMVLGVQKRKQGREEKTHSNSCFQIMCVGTGQGEAILKPGVQERIVWPENVLNVKKMAAKFCLGSQI